MSVVEQSMAKTMKLSGFGILALAAAISLLAGCGRATRMAVPIEGTPLEPAYGTTVEVTNWNGSVHIVADPRVRAAQVSARVRTSTRGTWKKEGDLVAAADVKATSTIGANGRTLTVVSAPATQPPKDIAVDLFIRVPKVSATHVRNSGGSVEVVRTEGPVDVVNSGSGGDIQVRTGAAMTEPSTLMTNSGRVLYQVGPGSTGRFDLAADKGPSPQFSSRLGEANDVRPEMLRYTCIFNDGKNPVVLRSGDGLVRATVMADAGEYGPEIWDGYFVWPQYPRWVGRLGGYHNDEPALSHMRQQMMQGRDRAAEVQTPPPQQ
jgi:hypothetical protein